MSCDIQPQRPFTAASDGLWARMSADLGRSNKGSTTSLTRPGTPPEKKRPKSTSSGAGFLGPLWDAVKEKLSLGSTTATAKTGTESEGAAAAAKQQMPSAFVFTAGGGAPGRPTASISIPGAPSASTTGGRPTRDEVMQSYQALMSSGFFDAHAIRSTRHGPPPAQSQSQAPPPPAGQLPLPPLPSPNKISPSVATKARKPTSAAAASSDQTSPRRPAGRHAVGGMLAGGSTTSLLRQSAAESAAAEKKHKKFFQSAASSTKNESSHQRGTKRANAVLFSAETTDTSVALARITTASSSNTLEKPPAKKLRKSSSRHSLEASRSGSRPPSPRAEAPPPLPDFHLPSSCHVTSKTHNNTSELYCLPPPPSLSVHGSSSVRTSTDTTASVLASSITTATTAVSTSGSHDAPASGSASTGPARLRRQKSRAAELAAATSPKKKPSSSAAKHNQIHAAKLASVRGQRSARKTALRREHRRRASSTSSAGAEDMGIDCGLMLGMTISGQGGNSCRDKDNSDMSGPPPLPMPLVEPKRALPTPPSPLPAAPPVVAHRLHPRSRAAAANSSRQQPGPPPHQVTTAAAASPLTALPDNVVTAEAAINRGALGGISEEQPQIIKRKAVGTGTAKSSGKQDHQSQHQHRRFVGADGADENRDPALVYP